MNKVEYHCSCCSRLVRSTGQSDNDHAKICVDCYILGGLMGAVENFGLTRELESRIKQIQDAIIEQGGKKYW